MRDLGQAIEVGLGCRSVAPMIDMFAGWEIEGRGHEQEVGRWLDLFAGIMPIGCIFRLDAAARDRGGDARYGIRRGGLVRAADPPSLRNSRPDLRPASLDL